jgi:hypothetical protein
MGKQSHTHTGEEFGKSPSSGSSTAGLDGPVIGASSAIMLDALTERESGVTPPPPPVSVRAIAITLVVMLALGIILLLFITRVLHSPLAR